MTKLHFDDLTQITCPFWMRDDDTQERLRACDEVQYFEDLTKITCPFWMRDDDGSNPTIELVATGGKDE